MVIIMYEYIYLQVGRSESPLSLHEHMEDNRSDNPLVDAWECGTPLPRRPYKEEADWNVVTEHLNSEVKGKLEATMDALGDDGRHQLASPVEYLNWASYVKDRTINYFGGLKKEDCVVTFLPELELKYNREKDICSMMGFMHLVFCGPKHPDEDWVMNIRQDLPYIICEKVERIECYRHSATKSTVAKKVPKEVLDFYLTSGYQPTRGGKNSLRDSTYSRFFFANLYKNGVDNPILSDNASKKPTLTKEELSVHKSRNHKQTGIRKRSDFTREELAYLDEDANLPTLANLSKMYIPDQSPDVMYLNNSLVKVHSRYNSSKGKGQSPISFYQQMISCFRIKLLYNAIPCHWIDFERFGATCADYDKYEKKVIKQRCIGSNGTQVNREGDTRWCGKGDYFDGKFGLKKSRDLLKLTRELSEKSNLPTRLKVKSRRRQGKLKGTGQDTDSDGSGAINKFRKNQDADDVDVLFKRAEEIQKEISLREENKLMRATLLKEETKKRKVLARAEAAKENNKNNTTSRKRRRLNSGGGHDKNQVSIVAMFNAMNKSQ